MSVPISNRSNFQKQIRAQDHYNLFGLTKDLAILFMPRNPLAHSLLYLSGRARGVSSGWNCGRVAELLKEPIVQNQNPIETGKVISFGKKNSLPNSLDEAKQAEESSFEETQRRNKEAAERMKKERAKANKSVLRAYRIKN